MQNIYSRVSVCILIVVSCFCLATVTSRGETETITVTPINLSELKEKISSKKGTVLIVDFWATWCPPCRREIPGFINLYKKYKDKGLEIIGVSLFIKKGIQEVQTFVQEFGINYPIFFGDNEIGNAYKVEGIPTTLIIGKDGETKSRHVGYVPEEDFEKEILALLK
ncbi:MAG TPA: TlpA family protein disulfide reductase [Candidatus Brocadiia bacterium]|nr:TlpA disulfide reductase family protein [Candidatus Brocadiales bacterium]